jgi:hypothetical protein
MTDFTNFAKKPFLPIFILAGWLSSGCSKNFVYLENDAVIAQLPDSSMFANCQGLDGGLRITWPGRQLAPVTLDWITDETSLRAEASDPIGRVLVELHIEEKQLKATGNLSGKLADLSIDGGGWLAMGGDRLPIRWGELGCLLKLRIPMAWRQSITSISLAVDSQGREVIFSEKARTMSLKFSKGGACGELEWPVLGGLWRETMLLCLDTSLKRGYANYSDWTVQWDLLDD